MTALKAKITGIGAQRFSRNGDVFFQRIKLQLEDGSFAMTDLVSSYRNYQWWEPVIKAGVGTVIGGIFLKDGYTKPLKVNADSQVFIIQDVLFNTQKEELDFTQTRNEPDHGIEAYNVQSETVKKRYEVTFDRGFPQCTCEAYRFGNGKKCKHIKEIEAEKRRREAVKQGTLL